MQKLKRKPEDIAVGDLVRIKRRKKVFDKGYEILWSLKKYKVINIQGLNYTLENGKEYRSASLQKVVPEEDELFEDKKEPKDIVKMAKKKRKTELELRREGIEEKHVEKRKRTRAPSEALIERVART